MKFLKIFLVVVICSSFKPPIADKVYVCDSKSSVAYHKTEDCSGLKRCKHEIISVTKNDAVNVYGKRACKICY